VHGFLPDHVASVNVAPSVSGTFTKVLPYLEQEGLYKAILADGLSAASVALRTYISPADWTATLPEAGSSYAANEAVFGNAALNLDRSFPDGCGATILFTERYMVCGAPPFPAFNAWPIAISGGIAGKYQRTVWPYLDVDAPLQFHPTMNDCQFGGASSFETGAILVALADGTVRPVSPGAAGAASSRSGVSNWQAALTPEGGEVLSSDW
jgi:hypothetical protein